MSTYPDRVQFRLSRQQSALVHELAANSTMSPSAIAKKLFLKGLELSEVDAGLLAEDLLIIRAGIEQLFRRADRVDELSEAVSAIKDRRKTRADQTLIGDAS